MRIRDWSSDVCSSDLDDQVLAQRRAQQFQRRTIAGALDPDRTAAAVAIAERCGKQTFLWITQRVREIICHAAAWCEAIGIITKALGVDTLEFNCEVRQPAVVFGIEAVRLAEVSVTDQTNHDINATHPHEDRPDSTKGAPHPN